MRVKRCKGQRAKDPKLSAASKSVDGLDLLDDEDGAGEVRNQLKISERFAKKFNARKDKEELARAQRILADEDEASSHTSDTDPEDEEAGLLTKNVESKIFDTLSKIKSRDPSIYDKSKIFFSDGDFEGRNAAKAAGVDKKKGMKYKDFIRDTLMKEGADAIAKEEYRLEKAQMVQKVMGNQKTPVEEQQDLRAQILSAVEGFDANDVEADDDLFTLKTKTEDELKEEQTAFDSFTARKNRDGTSDGDDIMARYWKADEDLDSNECFLRDFILNEGWKETASIQASSQKAARDDRSDEDEDHLDKADEFEKEYNFRFEVEEGQQIQSHSRFQESSVRQRPDKRKRQRAAKVERKQSEKIRRTEELKRLKNLKKDEIKRRLEQIKDVTGNDESALGSINLDDDFDPADHDTQMSALVGDGYEEQEEALAPDDLVKAPAGLQELDVSSAGADAVAIKQASKKLKSDGNIQSVPVEMAKDGEDDVRDNDPELWFLCDGCQRGIPASKRFFECAVCDNFTLCVNCFRVRHHPHKFVRKRVPDHCTPPEELKGMEPDREEVKNALDEYFQLDYEDIIGGDLPTRFKYRKVHANAYGMKPHEVLSKSDQELNRVIPLKKLRTYRDEGPPEQWQKGRKFHRQEGHRAADQGAGKALGAQRLDAYGFGQRAAKKSRDSTCSSGGERNNSSA